MVRKVAISHKTIIFTVVFLLGLWILYQILEVLLLLFVSIILMSALAPLVDTLVKYKLPKPLAILIVYLVIVLVFGSVITAGFSPLIDQTNRLTQKTTEVLNGLSQTTFVDQSILHQEIGNFSHNVISYTIDVLRSLIALVSIAVISFYLLLDQQRLESNFASLFMSRQDKIKDLIIKIETKLGSWLRGQFLLSLIISVMSYIGLTALGIEFALPLAIIAGLLEVIPVIGPILSAIPAILVALTVSPLLALFTALMFLFVQQLESHVIVPQVMKRAVGLNPILVILSISIGSKLLGVSGALLAVPIAVVIQVIGDEILHNEDLLPLN